MDAKLETLVADGVLDEVLGRLKSGKEADIWLARHGGQIVAAKLYRERQDRSFRNNADYKEGRGVASSRTRRAIERGSRFGKAAAEESWKSAEADALYKLHARGVRTPTPILFYEGVLVMELVVDAQGQPAPRLIDASLTPDAARDVYLELRSQVVRMLDADVIHGDLSAYNVLLGAAGPTLIDFPQHVAAAHNSRSEFFFRRDFENLRRHLAEYDRGLNSRGGDAREIWQAYVRRELTADFVPTGRVPVQPPARHEQRREPGPTSRPGRPGGPRGLAPADGRRGGRPAPGPARTERRPGPQVTHVVRLAAGVADGSGHAGGSRPGPAAPAGAPGPHRRRRRRRRGSGPPSGG